jgi:hypothetical protein
MEWNGMDQTERIRSSCSFSSLAYGARGLCWREVAARGRKWPDHPMGPGIGGGWGGGMVAAWLWWRRRLWWRRWWLSGGGGSFGGVAERRGGDGNAAFRLRIAARVGAAVSVAEEQSKWRDRDDRDRFASE